MTAKFFAILTNQGAALLANATALGTKLNITQMAVGDGNGTLPTPDATQTKLVNQRRIAPLNMLSVDANNSSQIIAEQVIPENEGGFWIREIGLYDDNGVLIAVANCPETYKPQLQEGSGRTQTIRMVLIVSSTAAVTLKIDPSVVLATRKYVDDNVIKVKVYADDLMRQHLAAPNPHQQYAPVNSPVLTGTPVAPTAEQTVDSGQIATTAFVKAAIAALVNGAPDALNTLQELAAALGDDPNYATTIRGELERKQPVSDTLHAIAALTGANKLMYLDEASKIQTATLTKLAREILEKDTASQVLNHLQAAPLASPEFTGNPTVPTHAISDSSKNIANTEFVINQIENDVYNAIFNLSLGAASKRDVGTGANQLPDMSAFPLVVSPAGWTKLPNGLILQWGVTTNFTSTAEVYFAIPFPTACLFVGKNTYNTTTNNSAVMEVVNPSRTGFTASNIATLIRNNTNVSTPVASGLAFFAVGY
ncbi:phage tail protein [Kosakonia pseudosacchari]|uniref:phage tail protein n=1 Tax=Kosakonia pseudosacchari TaxID=1646340 RepID=UPI003D95987C